MLKQVLRNGAKQTWIEKQKRNKILKYHLKKPQLTQKKDAKNWY